MNKKLVLALVLCLVLAMTGCSSTVVPEKADPDEPPVVETTTFEVGETVAYGNLYLTINEVKTSQGSNEWDKPDNGQYIIIDMTIENKGKEAEHVSTMLQMELVDEEGFSESVDIFAPTKGSLDGEVGPGRKVRGEVAFDVTTDSSYFEFIFSAPFSSGQAIWKIPMDE